MLNVLGKQPVRIQAALIGAGLFFVYALGASRTIYVGDSGELVAAVHTLGIPHPSGYPLYVLLGKAWTVMIPVGSIAFRMSLLSAACAAAACSALYLLSRRIGLGASAALLAALLLAFAPSFWSQANIQRVYALNALFVVLATGAALRWESSRSTRDLLMAFFLCGLGAANHTFMAIYAVAFGLFVIGVEGRVLLEPKAAVARVAAAAGAFAVGLLPYAYLPLRSRMNPRLDWGNPETIAGLRDVVLRQDFWERAWIESPADLAPILADYLAGVGTELAWVGAVLALIGIVAGARRQAVILALLVMAGNLVAMSLHGSRSDIFIWHRYYIPSYVMGALLAGLGWQVVVDALARRRSVLAWIILWVPAIMFAAGYANFDRSRYRLAEDFAEAVLESMPPGAHLIATDDNVLFVLIYLQLVEGRRPDVNLILQGVGKADLPPLRFDPDTEPLFFTHHPNWNLPTLEIVPIGVVYQARRRGKEPPAPNLTRLRLDGEQDPKVPKDYLTQNLIGHFHYTLGFTLERRDWPRALEEFEKAARAGRENDVLFYNLGLVFARNGWYEEAIAAFERSHRINPRHLASLSRPRASRKIAEVTAERARIAAIEARLGSGKIGRDHHLHMAQALEAQGEWVAARGHRLRALQPGTISDDPS